MQKVSLYIPCYNAARYLEQCLKGILAQAYPINEVLIVDDGSTDNTVEIASKYPVRIIRHKQNNGIAAARNTAILNARNEFVAALDADCIPEQDWLKNLMNNFNQQDVVGVGGRLVEFHTQALADKWRSIYMKQNWGLKRLINPPIIFGSNNVYRKEALEKIGLYNERYRTNGEDNDLTKRLLSRGFKLIYEPQAIAKHLRKDSIRSVLKMNWQWNFYGHTLPINLKNLLIGIFWDVCRIKGYLIHDIKAKRFNFLGLDILIGFYSFYMNFKTYLQKNLF